MSASAGRAPNSPNGDQEKTAAPSGVSADWKSEIPYFDEGLEMRTKVLGSEYVDRALGSADGFSRPFQEFMTAYCWGATWTRGGLPLKVRSLLTVAMLTALSKPKEIEAHVRGALNNGCDPAEILETLIHATVYCGVPAGVDAVRVAQRVIADSTS